MIPDPIASDWFALLRVRRRYAALDFGLEVRRFPRFCGVFCAVVYDPLGHCCGTVESERLSTVVGLLDAAIAKDAPFGFSRPV